MGKPRQVMIQAHTRRGQWQSWSKAKFCSIATRKIQGDLEEERKEGINSMNVSQDTVTCIMSVTRSFCDYQAPHRMGKFPSQQESIIEHQVWSKLKSDHWERSMGGTWAAGAMKYRGAKFRKGWQIEAVFIELFIAKRRPGSRDNCYVVTGFVLSNLNRLLLVWNAKAKGQGLEILKHW